MKAVFVAWQDPETRKWYPVGRLWREGEFYRFAYTQGARQSPRFLPFTRMSDLSIIYESDVLFPVFANRLLSPSRPEYHAFVQMMQVESHDPIALLGRSGGKRFTDSLEVFPCPEQTKDGGYHIHFFSHGIRHLGELAIQRIADLAEGTPLFLMTDPQNPVDPLAIALRSDDPPTIVGYCPRYLTSDFHQMLKGCGAGFIHVTVKAINRDAPLQFMMLCEAYGCWPDGFQPCSDPDYLPIPSSAPQC